MIVSIFGVFVVDWKNHQLVKSILTIFVYYSSIFFFNKRNAKAISGKIYQIIPNQ